MNNRFKSTKDYLHYVARHSKKEIITLVIDVIILACALYDYESVLSKPNWFLIALSAFTQFIWQSYNVISHLKPFSQTEYTGDGGQSPIINTVDSDEEYMLTSEMDKKYEKMAGIHDFYIPKETKEEKVHLRDFLLTDEPIQVHINDHKTQNVNKLIKSSWPILGAFLSAKYHQKTLFFNDKKLCLASEIKQENGKWEAFVCEGEYYNGHLTNEIYNRYLIDKTGAQYHSPYDALIFPISLLDYSIFSNHIGVSTILMVKEEKRICLLVQQKENNINPGKIVPTGSGSMDYEDMGDLTDLKQIVIRAAERELFEETSFNAEQMRTKGWDVQTKIIGFYRDLSRGGKPEFCCVTEVSEHSSNEITIQPREIESLTNLHEFFPIEKVLEEVNLGNKQNQNIKSKKVEVYKGFKKSNTLRANLYFLEKYLNA